MSTTVLVATLAGYGRRAHAACEPDPSPPTYSCTGANTDQQTITVDNAIVTTEPGFSVITGDPYGVQIEGDGALSFTDDNASTLTADNRALFVYAQGDDGDTLGSITIITDGNITGGQHGIAATNFGSGAINITATGTTTGADTFDFSYGISAYNRGAGIDITTEGVVSGGYRGISAFNAGGGSLNITASGEVYSAGTSGIVAFNGRPGEDAAENLIIITTETGDETTTVTGGYEGIRARNYGTGELSITTAGPVTGMTGAGINAANGGIFDDTVYYAGTTLSVDTAAVYGNTYGILARNYGSGALTIDASGTVEAEAETGIGIDTSNGNYLEGVSAGTNIVISTQAVSGGAMGIRTRNAGTGYVDITAAGDVNGGSGYGIYAANSTNGTSLTIVTGYVPEGSEDAPGIVTGGTGILAVNNGNEALAITAHGAVTGTSGAGIFARNFETASTGDLTIETESVSGQTHGIDARNDAAGKLEIITNGHVQGGAADNGIHARLTNALSTDLIIVTDSVSGGDTGIYVSKDGGSGDINITTNGVATGGQDGITAFNLGTGAISITANSDVEGTVGVGIFGYNETTANGLSVTIGAASHVYGYFDAVRALNRGAGPVEIEVDGSVESELGIGIDAQNDTSGDDLTITTGIGSSVKGALTGISAVNYGGALRIEAKGNVTSSDSDAIEARNGSDTLTGGTSLTVMTGTGTTVSGLNHGIYAQNYGTGALTVTALGNVQGSDDDGIFAYNFSSAAGDLTVTTGAGTSVTGGDRGILADSRSANAAVAVNIGGDVSGGANEGIYAVTLGTNLTVTTAAGTTVQGSDGINAENDGTGTLTITALGDVFGNGATSTGIAAYSAASTTGALSVTTGGTVAGGWNGISVVNLGSGAIEITTNGAVTGTVYAGISAEHLGSGGSINITVNEASTVTGGNHATYGFAIATVGATNATVAGTLIGGAAGAVQFDQVTAHDDQLALVTGAVVTGNAFGGPGTDTLALQGGGDGSFDVGQLVDFEIAEKTGGGNWDLTGSNTQLTSFTVDGGLLSVNGALPNAAFTVTGGTLGGNGTVGPVNVASGGVIAPGNSIGTLTVNGAFTLQAGAIYEVEANAAGEADKVIVAGTVNLSGAVLRVLAANGNYKPKTEYVIIENDGSDAVQGRFAEVTANLAFLTPSVIYDGGSGNDVVLILERTAADFCAAAKTRNQCNVANALDQFPTDDPLFLAVLNQTAAGARQAFDALSGEIHATLPGVLADDSRYVREAVLGRLVQATYTNDAGQVASLGAGGPQVAALNTLDSHAMALGYDGKHLAPPEPSYGAAFWTRAYGAWGDFDGNGNAASADRDLGGFISGLDTQIATNWRAGLAAGGAWSNVAVDDRHSSADIESFNLAGYVGGLAGPLALRGGGSWTWSEIDTSRAVIFPGFFERQDSSYDADTGQIFGEVAYPVSSGRIAFEPFVGLAYVSIDTDSFRERGGDLSALTGSSNDEDIGYSTLGLRAATVAHVASLTVVPKISAAWQHAFDDVTPGASLAFASTGIGFGVTGVPLAEDSFLLEAGLDLALSATATLGVSYTGQFADDVSDNGIKGRLSWLF